MQKFGSKSDDTALVAHQEDVKIAWAGPLFREAASPGDGAIQRAVVDALPAYRIVPGNDVAESGSRFVELDRLRSF